MSDNLSPKGQLCAVIASSPVEARQRNPGSDPTEDTSEGVP